MRDFIGFVVICIIALVAIFSFIIGFGTTLEYIDCNSYGRATEQQVKFDWGCYVYADNQWLPKSTVVGKTVIIK